LNYEASYGKDSKDDRGGAIGVSKGHVYAAKVVRLYYEVLVE
jgi:hypothetical protein